MQMNVLVHRSGGAALLLWIVVFANDVQAQCSFDHSSRARSIKLSMVRAMSGCSTGDTTTADGLPACSNPSPQSDYRFDGAGRCDFRMVHEAGAACPLGGACSEMSISAKCSGVRDASDV